VGDTMVTSRAEMEWNINQTLRALKHKLHFFLLRNPRPEI
jgi:hypothetical protein